AGDPFTSFAAFARVRGRSPAPTPRNAANANASVPPAPATTGRGTHRREPACVPRAARRRCGRFRRLALTPRPAPMMRSCTFWLAVSLAVSARTWAADRPNVVVILADDQGWGDLSVH